MKSKPSKMKKYTAMSVMLNVKMELAASNRNRQFSICVRAASKKRVAELLAAIGHNSSLTSLNSFNGLMENETYSFNPPKDEEVYFKNEHPDTPHFGEWLAFSEWKNN